MSSISYLSNERSELLITIALVLGIVNERLSTLMTYNVR